MVEREGISLSEIHISLDNSNYAKESLDNQRTVNESPRLPDFFFISTGKKMSKNRSDFGSYLSTSTPEMEKKVLRCANT
jgi:hypothetical protein